MKKLFNSMMAIAIAACTFTSCEDVPEPYNNPYSYTPAETIAPKGTGTQADPFNVAAALAKCQEVGETGTTEDVYAEGYVVSIKSIDVAQYNNAEFSIADSKEGGDMLTVYRAKGPGNQPITDANIIKNGDKVLICGKLVNYKGNTPEFTQGCYIVSVNGEGGDPTPGPTPDPQPTPTGDNLLQNGDFESWEGDVAVNWQSATTASTKGTLQKSTNAHAGSFAALAKHDAGGNKRIAYKEITLKPGTYTMKFYVKAADAAGTSVNPGYVAVVDGAVSGSYQYGGYVNDITTEWQEVTNSFTLSAQTTVNLVVMIPKNAATDAIIDDFELLTSDGGLVDGDDPTPGPTPSGEAKGDGTLTNPYNPLAAINYAESLGGSESPNDVYVKGKIATIKYTYSAQFGTATYTISEDGTDNNLFTVYGSYYHAAEQKWVEGDTQIAVGDEVLVCGKVVNYQGNTPEFVNKKNWLVSITKAN